MDIAWTKDDLGLIYRALDEGLNVRGEKSMRAVLLTIDKVKVALKQLEDEEGNPVEDMEKDPEMPVAQQEGPEARE